MAPDRKLLLFPLLFLPPIVTGVLNRDAVRIGTQVPTGLVDGALRPCPPDSACVSTEDGGEGGPLVLEGRPEAAFAALVERLADLRNVAPTTLEADHAVLTRWTPYLDLVDRVELRLDAERGLVHVRCLGPVALGLERVRALLGLVREVHASAGDTGS